MATGLSQVPSLQDHCPGLAPLPPTHTAALLVTWLLPSKHSRAPLVTQPKAKPSLWSSRPAQTSGPCLYSLWAGPGTPQPPALAASSPRRLCGVFPQGCSGAPSNSPSYSSMSRARRQVPCALLVGMCPGGHAILRAGI